MRIQKVLKNKLVRVPRALTFLFALVTISCDFTPPLYKELLNIQDLIKTQKYKEAVDEYEKILSRNPPAEIATKIHYQLAELYSTFIVDYEEAISHYDQTQKYSVELNVKVKSLEKIANINFEQLKDFEESARIYKTLSHFEPKLQNTDYFSFREALSYYHLRDYDKAIEKFTEIASTQVGEYQLLSMYQIGMCHFEKKDWAKAIVKFEEYILKEKRKNKIVLTKFLIGNAYESMEKLENAYESYYSIMGDYPNTQVLLNRLNSVYNRRVSRKR